MPRTWSGSPNRRPDGRGRCCRKLTYAEVPGAHLVIDPFNARMASSLIPSVRALYAEGDWVIALFDASGTARGGEPYNNTCSWYLRLQDGKIVIDQSFETSSANWMARRCSIIRLAQHVQLAAQIAQ